MKQSVKFILSKATGRLSQKVDLPDLEAQLLLAHLLGKTRTWLYAWPEALLGDDQQREYESLVSRRIQGEPVAHLIGEREFWSQHIEVTPDTLIPRPETELLVETILDRYRPAVTLSLADLGTGSGAIAIAIASECPLWKITATDNSVAALDIAKRNAAKNGVEINFCSGSWFDALPENARFDVIVSNPPYIREDDPHLTQGDVRFDPRSALVSGSDGLDDIRLLINEAPRFLNNDGLLIIEHGYDQSEAVQQLMQKHGLMQISTIHDLSGQPRVTLGIN